MNPKITKIFHGMQQFAEMISFYMGHKFRGMIRGTMDLQLGMELLTGNCFSDFEDMLNHELFQSCLSDGSYQTKFVVNGSGDIRDTRVLLLIYSKLMLSMGEARALALGQASDRRASEGKLYRKDRGKGLVFDIANGYRLASYELLDVTRPDDIAHPGGSDDSFSNGLLGDDEEARVTFYPRGTI